VSIVICACTFVASQRTLSLSLLLGAWSLVLAVVTLLLLLLLPVPAVMLIIYITRAQQELGGLRLRLLFVCVGVKEFDLPAAVL